MVSILDRARKIADNLFQKDRISRDQWDALDDALKELSQYRAMELEPEEVADRLQSLERFENVVGFMTWTRIEEIARAEQSGQLVVLPFVAMVEQSLQNRKMTPQRDQRFNGRYAVVYSDPDKWGCPLIDICGGPYDRTQAEERMAALAERESIRDQLIHLCFTCDPYPTGYDTTATREVIKVIKETGNHVQILTKGDGSRDFDLLDGGDWYGVTYAGYKERGFELYEPVKSEPMAAPPLDRLACLHIAHREGIKTWVSMEPVLDAEDVLRLISLNLGYIDRYKIGKLNYHPSEIDWADFGRKAEALCQELGLDYYIKESLRAEMEGK